MHQKGEAVKSAKDFMKKLISKQFVSKALIVSMIGSLCAMPVYGADTIEFSHDGGTITGVSNIPADGRVVIPDKIGEDVITKINAGAFENNTDITSIYIPASIKTVNSSAFFGCTNLEKFEVDPTNKALYTDDVGALYFKSSSVRALMSFPAAATPSNYTTEDDLTTIANGAFQYANNLQSVTIPSGKIGTYAFNESDISEIKLGADVTGINEETFRGSNIKTFSVDDANPVLEDKGNALFAKDGKLYAASDETDETVLSEATSVSPYAFLDRAAYDRGNASLPQEIQAHNVFVFHDHWNNFMANGHVVFCYNKGLDTPITIDDGREYADVTDPAQVGIAMSQEDYSVAMAKITAVLNAGVPVNASNLFESVFDEEYNPNSYKVDVAANATGCVVWYCLGQYNNIDVNEIPGIDTGIFDKELVQIYINALKEIADNVTGPYKTPDVAVPETLNFNHENGTYLSDVFSINSNTNLVIGIDEFKVCDENGNNLKNPRQIKTGTKVRLLADEDPTGKEIEMWYSTAGLKMYNPTSANATNEQHALMATTNEFSLSMTTSVTEIDPEIPEATPSEPEKATPSNPTPSKATTSDAEISKLDITNSKPLAGAKLRFTKEDGTLIKEMTSGTDKIKISNLEPGKYVLTEITAPNGYEIAESVTVTIGNDGKVYPVVMYDAPSVKPEDPEDSVVYIQKISKSTKKTLSGATLRLEDSTGKEISTFETDGESENFTVPAGTYKLIEEDAPSGYRVASPITFTVVAGETKTVIMEDARKSSGGSSGGSSSSSSSSSTSSVTKSTPTVTPTVIEMETEVETKQEETHISNALPKTGDGRINIPMIMFFLSATCFLLLNAPEIMTYGRKRKRK